jgi:hypothetical protein
MKLPFILTRSDNKLAHADQSPPSLAMGSFPPGKPVKQNLIQTYLEFWFPVLLAIGVFEWMQFRQSDGMGISLPFLISWMLMPAIAWKISQTDKGKAVSIDENKNYS